MSDQGVPEMEAARVTCPACGGKGHHDGHPAKRCARCTAHGWIRPSDLLRPDALHCTDCYDRGYAAGRASLVEIDNLAAIFTECDLGNEVSHCRCRDRMLNLCRRIRTAFEMKVAEDGKP